MQEYAEFQYRRRHRQRLRGSLLSNAPDPDDPSESTLGEVWHKQPLLSFLGFEKNVAEAWSPFQANKVL